MSLQSSTRTGALRENFLAPGFQAIGNDYSEIGHHVLNRNEIEPR